MIELKGKHAEAKIFTDNVEHSALSHIIAFLNQESLQGSKVRIMPDVHDGAGCVIGTTMTIVDKVIPNVVGCDIGCGVLAIELKEKRIDLPKLDSVIRKNVAVIRSTELKEVEDLGLENLVCRKDNVKAVRLGFGTVGGGNHFIEIDKDEETGALYLLIHSGSRNLGIQVANYYQDKAYDEAIVRFNRGTFNDKVTELKKVTSPKDMNKAVEKLKKEYKRIGDVPYELAYVTGQNFKDYIHDMKIAQNYAAMNRRKIASIIMKEMKLHEVDSFDTIHNYIDIENMIVRKGSVRAALGEKLIVPINMRDGALICVGKGNEDWNSSCCHGAGRLMSRADAKQNISVSEFKKTMKDAGIFSTCVGKGTIDESPMAYKPMEEIVEIIKDTVDIVKVIKPIYNFKAGETEE